LERECDQVAKTTMRHGVLIGKKPVVRIQSDLVPTFHRPREHRRTQLPGKRCGGRLLEKNPDMGSAT
ncbi:MAG: hypothetical protein WBL39_00115, partial [Terrimicrobiaceae bacterium]